MACLAGVLARAELRGDDVEPRVPLAVGFDANPEREPLLVHAGALRRRDLRGPAEGPPVVAELELAVRHALRVRPLLRERVLHLEKVGEVAARLDAHREVRGLVGVVQDRQLLVEPVRDRASPDDRELRVDVHRPRSRHEEEAGLEVLQVVDRERVQALAVDRQDPAREEARVVGEETGRVGQ